MFIVIEKWILILFEFEKSDKIWIRKRKNEAKPNCIMEIDSVKNCAIKICKF